MNASADEAVPSSRRARYRALIVSALLFSVAVAAPVAPVAFAAPAAPVAAPVPRSSWAGAVTDLLVGDPSQATLVVLAGLVALLAVLQGALWYRARTVVTMAHEAGHALVALLSGRTLTKILLHSDTSGVTVSRGRRDGAGMVATAAAGYMTPPVLGLMAGAMVAIDRIPAMLGIAVMLLLGTLALVRNAFGIAAVVLTGAAFVLVAIYGSSNVQYAFACFVTWFLILGGLRTVVEVQRKRAGRRATDSDPDQLERLTAVPAGIWVAIFGLTAVLSLLAAGKLMAVWPQAF